MNHVVDPTISRASWQHSANRTALAITIITLTALAVAAAIYANSVPAVITAGAAAVLALGATFIAREHIPALAH